ncbi:MAG: hypothetical protein CXT67_00225 [Methanobacteriota archaeon]|nr:MAG: hypothetical protein CXT67_00225 [Euryarchaeota archaeon]
MNKLPFKPAEHVLNDIWGTLSLLISEIGTTFPIPSRTAAMISERRKLTQAHTMLIDDSLVNHTGWASLAPCDILDTPIMLSLWKELSEMHDVPVGFFSSLVYYIRTDPSFMDIRIRGFDPFLIDKSGCPTINLDEAVYSTPSLMRAAWDGALSGNYWDVEAIMMLPKTVNYSPEIALKHAERVGIEVEFA